MVSITNNLIANIDGTSASFSGSPLQHTGGNIFLSSLLKVFHEAPICDSSLAYFVLLFSYSWLCPLDI